MKKVIGWLMIAAIFVLIFIGAADRQGYMVTLHEFIGIAALCGWIFVAVLLTED